MMAKRSYRLAAVLALALGLPFAGIAAAEAPAAVKAATHTVVIEGVRFMPDTLTVKAGDTVVWVNKDPFPHTATSQGAGFDSHEIAAGESWKYTPKKAGVFDYICTLHPTMKATLTVR